MYTVVEPKKRVVGCKLSLGMEIPKKLEGKALVYQLLFRFSRLIR